MIRKESEDRDGDAAKRVKRGVKNRVKTGLAQRREKLLRAESRKRENSEDDAA